MMTDERKTMGDREKAEMVRIAKWIGYAYLPIVILVIMIFALAEYHFHEIESGKVVIVESIKK